MFSDERKQKIIHLLKEKQSLTVTELVDLFHVSESTIRRDLHELEKIHELKRTHGGAIAAEVSSFEPSLQEKIIHYPSEKKQIARIAVSMIEEGETVILDSGTTTAEIARQLPNIDLTIITNSLQIGQEVSSLPRAKLIFLGGELRPTTGAMVGPLTESMLCEMNADKLFLGANAVSLNRGISTPNPTEASTKKAMIASAREVILVADHSKLGKRSLTKVCDLANLTHFLTERTLPEPYHEAFAKHNVHVIAAESSLPERKE
ncbi:MAG TPA: DeoR/GlpR family DNA-binding transcription regulator [Bacillales bacterium]|nr:DeoR/GlpR family DNA-binding transcription regulator [Bacillales bacterium]